MKISVNLNIGWGYHAVNQDSNYKITYAIWDISLGAPVKGPTEIEVEQIFSSHTVEILDWDCNQSIETANYIILVKVELLKEAEYCSGDARSSTLTCAELYDNITINVPMDY